MKLHKLSILRDTTVNSQRLNIPMAKTGGGLLDKTMKCNSCSWEWKAADGGSDIDTCHKCGSKALPKAQNAGEDVQVDTNTPIGPYKWDSETGVDLGIFKESSKGRGQRIANIAMAMAANGEDGGRPPLGVVDNIRALFDEEGLCRDNTCVQTVKDFYRNAGIDAIPEDVYNNREFLKNFKEYGFVEILDHKNIQPGDAIIGLSSFGETSYESQYNGGMGSNGLTSARHDVFEKYLSVKYPESYDQNILDSLVYSGSKELTSEIKGVPVNAGKLVLSPTRTYAPVIVKILEKHRADINGMVHCSGGAQTKILHFIDQNHIIKDNLFEVPPLFNLIQKESKTPWKEMYKVFNMGHRMEIYTNPSNIQSIIDICNEFNLEAKQIGRVEELNTKKLTIVSEKGEFIY